MLSLKRSGILYCLLLIALGTTGQDLKTIKRVKPVPPVSTGADGKLSYTADSLGNRIPDYSFCGYMAGEKDIPNVPVRIVVPVSKGDATLRIQTALDYVSSLPIDKNGFRGAVLLQKGLYEIQGQLVISNSGVVLRGSGMGADGTLLMGAGNDRQTLIRITGKNDVRKGAEIRITDEYVPVNSFQVSVVDPSAFKTGDMVFVHRPSAKEWIALLGTDHFGGGITDLGWKPGSRDIYWDRKIVKVNGNILTLDAPLTTALDANLGGGLISAYTWNGRIQQAGIENLRCRSIYDINNPKDEAHRWMAITLENVQDSWVRQVTFEHFAGSAVAVWETAKRITVEDCKNLSPVSEIGGQRRYSFWTTGQQTLFQRLYAEYGYHDFAAGFCSSLNAFVQCDSYLPYSFSGCIDSWSSAVLFDVVNIEGNALSFKNLGQDKQGAGWNAANSMFWNCTAARVDCYAPPAAQNWAFGTWAQFSGDGFWWDSNNSISPRSFYYAQLKDRTGQFPAARARILNIETDASSSPSVKVAAKLTKLAYEPRIQMKDFIDQSTQTNPVSLDSKDAKTIDQIGYKITGNSKPVNIISLQNGRLLIENSVITGGIQSAPWWRGSVRPAFLQDVLPAVTRFVPGRTGNGLTDDLDVMTDSMVKGHDVVFDQNYALWYERRRDDHERIRRMDGDVWAPFYEVPFARSGQELAWDGLSKYDLTKYNTWYWLRLKQFAGLADKKGLVLFHENYFQHNIIEAGAHWADCPWRPANNINHTGFPEPPAYAGDKRIFMAEQFYDTTHAIRNAIHKAYIRQCLENFKNTRNVIQFTSAEFTGPFHFVQFWLETIRDWEKETGNKELIGLATTKDVQDSILSDPKLASIVDVIDINYWFYRSDGSAYAPKGGQNLAPRQHARLIKPGKTSFEQVYRAVREYRQKFPEKAVIYTSDSYDTYGWAVLMAGGSIPCLPAITNSQLLKSAALMDPVNLPGNPEHQWAMAGKDGLIVFNDSGKNVNLDLTGFPSSLVVRFINPVTGQMISNEQKIKGGSFTEIKSIGKGAVIIWISRI